MKQQIKIFKQGNEIKMCYLIRANVFYTELVYGERVDRFVSINYNRIPTSTDIQSTLDRVFSKKKPLLVSFTTEQINKPNNKQQ